MDLGLGGKRVFITASSSGIGLQIAKVFLQEGARVVLNGRDAKKLDKARIQLQQEIHSSVIEIFIGDMCKQDIVLSSSEFIEKKWGGLDILIPNLGTGKPLSPNRLDIAEWTYMMERNLYSTVNLISAFESLLMKGNRSSIVMVSSIVAYERANTPYAYAASKGSILALNSYLAGDYAAKNIRVNCVVPGNVFFHGGRWEELFNADQEGVERYINENVPMKRFANPDEIADTVVFLASERASFTTGAAVVVDGGQRRSF